MQKKSLYGELRLSTLTSCPLDCYDTCSMTYEKGKLKAIHSGLTQGFLCPHLNHYEDFARIEVPRYKGNVITMDKALQTLKEIIQEDPKILHYRGRGNFALMQGVSDHFFASFGATLTNGSLCDGAGEAGILIGRGDNEIMTPQEIAKAEVIIFWGRNPHTTSSHLLPYIKDKKIIVIDPIQIQIAKSADLYIQIKPHGDLELAMLLSRFLYIEGGIDEDFLQKNALQYQEFYELTQTVRIKAVLDRIGVTLGNIGDLLELIKGKKVAILCGVGIQKYLDGADVIRAIDAFGVLLGLHGKEGCGVSYMGDSMRGIESPFLSAKVKRVSKVDTKFSEYNTVFVQGANPLNQMPDAMRVNKEMDQVKNLIYFGLYENQTSSKADLVIPAKTFLEKNDIRTSYATHMMYEMSKLKESEIGISEYDLTKYLCDAFNIELKSEKEYLEHFKSFTSANEDNTFTINDREAVAYEDGFSTEDGEFIFLDEIDSGNDESDKFYLLTCKSQKSLNSQFKVDNKVYLHPSLGYKTDEMVRISSANGEVVLPVGLDERLRKDCVLIYSGTEGVNRLTTSKRSYEGNSAVYQENRVNVESLER